MGTDTLVGLRAVLYDDPPTNWGIRDLRFRLDTGGAYLHADEPAVRVTSDVVINAEHLSCPDPDLARRLKTWLGLRYDRPAVPQEFVDLADDIAKRLRKPGNKPSEERVRDISRRSGAATTASRSTTSSRSCRTPRSPADPALLTVTREWLAGVVLNVPDRLGFPVDIEARTDEQISLAFIERSFSLDVSQVSWPETSPGPAGAV